MKVYLGWRLCFLIRIFPLLTLRFTLILIITSFNLDIDVVLGLVVQVPQLLQAGGGGPGLVLPLLGHTWKPDTDPRSRVQLSLVIIIIIIQIHCDIT